MFRWLPIFDEENDGPDDAWSRWGWGVAVPILMAIFGVSRIVIQQATLNGFRGEAMKETVREVLDKFEAKL